VMFSGTGVDSGTTVTGTRTFFTTCSPTLPKPTAFKSAVCRLPSPRDPRHTWSGDWGRSIPIG
jgi:hypothetical protein